MSGQVLLLTRSKQDNFRFVESLKNVNVSPEIINIPSVEYIFKELEPSLDIKSSGKIILTSRRAAEWVLKHKDAFLNRIFLVVGAETALELRQARLEVESHFQNVNQLQKELSGKLSAIYLYLRGETVKTDLCQILRSAGHECHETIVYNVSHNTGINPFLFRKIQASEIILFPLFSEASAQYVIKALFESDLRDMRTRTKVLCISDAVLKSVADKEWLGEYVSQEPTLKSMCKLVEETSNE